MNRWSRTRAWTLRSLTMMTTLVLLLRGAPPAVADDDDGPDCGRVIHDFGDAPEGLYAYGPSGPIGHFPSCLAPTAPGNQVATCPARGSAPGPTGYVEHVQDGSANYWLGCYENPANPYGSLYGIDSESDAKVNLFGAATSVCGTDALDCGDAWSFYGPREWGQDECRGDNSDAGLVYPGEYFHLFGCPYGAGFTLTFTTGNCGGSRTAYLNILADLDHDGDWSDVVPTCPPNGPCADEWEIKNLAITVAAGCGTTTTPEMALGATSGPLWVRITLTDQPVGDDFPWAGSANAPGGVFAGGETEDYIAITDFGDASRTATWGAIKLHYR